MTSRLTDMLNRLRLREGRYSNLKADRGGRTDWGISERAHPEAWADGVVTREEADFIYAEDYFAHYHLELLEAWPRLQEMVFDFIVNANGKRVIQMLQRLVGATPDGVLGPHTVARIAAYPPLTIHGVALTGPEALLFAFEGARLVRYAQIVKADPTQSVMIEGWVNRTLHFRSLTLP